MADMYDITVRAERRPCRVDGEKGMFHRWIDRAQIAPPSMMVGGHGGGQLWEVFGLIELENGHVIEAKPSHIVFADTEVKQ